MASKEYQQLLQELMSRPISENPTLEEIRQAFSKMMSDYPPEPDIRFEEFMIGSMKACWAFAPGTQRGVRRDKIVLFFFGGGYTIGTIEQQKDLLSRIGREAGAAVLAIQYRQAPENPFPAALDDALTAYKWLIHHPYPHNHIALAGASAGGGLALALLLRLKLEKISLPAAAVCLCPWVDLSKKEYADRKDMLTVKRLIEASELYCNGKNPENPLISPLFGDFSGMPPILVQAGTQDLLYEENVAFSERVESATLEPWPEMIHCWQLFAKRIPEGQQAIERIGKFLKGAFQSQ